MELLLLLTYGALCATVFRVFRLPLNKWTVPTAVLGGIALVAALTLLMNFNHPYSESTREYFITTPVVPLVKGRVIEVPVRNDAPVQAGDVLYRLDPKPFELAVDGLTARLAAAEKDLARIETLVSSGSMSARMLDESRALVDELTAKLDDARYDLEQTVVRAPSDGHVTQLTLREGMIAVPINLNPVMTFIHEESRFFVGWYRQNNMLRIRPGDEAEIAFDAIPGEVFTGRVRHFLSAVAQGQLQPTADLKAFDPNAGPGRVAVVIDVTDPDFAPYRQQLPVGLFGQSALYSEHMHHVAVMRRILLRMSSWLNFVFPFH